jgi:hypothetical protein
MTIYAWLPIAVLCCGCDASFNIRGSVVDGSGAPVASASVKMTCPTNSSFERTGTTDEKGQFSFGGVSGGTETVSCDISIAKAGFATKTVKASEVCHRSSKTGDGQTPCDPKTSVVTLKP